MAKIGRYSCDKCGNFGYGSPGNAIRCSKCGERSGLDFWWECSDCGAHYNYEDSSSCTCRSSSGNVHREKASSKKKTNFFIKLIVFFIFGIISTIIFNYFGLNETLAFVLAFIIAIFIAIKI